MTDLLQQAISEIAKLPDAQQDAIALQLLAILKDEQAWQARWMTTTDSQWDNLATMVRNDIKAGKVMPLDEVF